MVHTDIIFNSLFFVLHLFILGYQFSSHPEPQTVVQCSFLQPLVKQGVLLNAGTLHSAETQIFNNKDSKYWSSREILVLFIFVGAAHYLVMELTPIQDC